MKVKVDRFSTRDISDTPEGFEKRYKDKRPRPRQKSPLEEPPRPSSMKELLERHGLEER